MTLTPPPLCLTAHQAPSEGKCLRPLGANAFHIEKTLFSEGDKSVLTELHVSSLRFSTGYLLLAYTVQLFAETLHGHA